MKNFLLNFVFVFFLFPINATSQPDNEPSMLVMWENEIPPSMISEYETVVKKEIAIFKKLNYPRSCYVYQSEDFHYWWVLQIKDLNDFEEFSQEFGAFIMRMEKEEEFVFSEEFKGKTNFMKPTILKWLPNLSCMPDGVMKFDQSQYFRWGLCYVKVGFEAEFAQKWEEMTNIFKDNQIEIGWQLYTGVIGTENPFYMWGEIYDSPLDMETKRANTFQKLGQEFNLLWNETLQYIRKLDVQEGWYRSDLSYIINN